MRILKVEDDKKLLLVEWVDSAQPISGWRHLSDLPKIEIIECVSVGWQVGKTDSVIMLAPNIGDIESGDNAQASGFIRIPTAAVTRIAELKEG
jgi:hypothetical protein